MGGSEGTEKPSVALGALLPWTELEDPNAASFTDSQGREHKGVLKMDATCADAEMRYPVDVDIIHDGCRKATDYIIKVCETFGLQKPRTNYKHARQIENTFFIMLKIVIVKRLKTQSSDNAKE